MPDTVEHTIKTDTVLIGSTEYTLTIDFKLPDGYAFDQAGHFNRLYITFDGTNIGEEKQNLIVKEHPDFPAGIPIRGIGRDVDLLVKYQFRYYKGNNPEDTREAEYKFRIPVRFDFNSGNTEVCLSRTLNVS